MRDSTEAGSIREAHAFGLLADAVTALCACGTENQVVEVVRRSARALCGAAGIAIVWREGETCHYIAEDSAVPIWTGQRFPMDACISGWAMNNGDQVAISDIFSDPRVPHEAYLPTGVKSLVMTPVGEPPVAALGAYWLDVREHAPAEVSVLKALAECMAAALRTIELRQSLESQFAESEQRRAEREDARNEAAFQAHLLDVVEQAVMATDPDGRVIYWNAFAEELYGWTRQEALGRSVLELKAASDDPYEAEQLMQLLQAGQSWSGELVLQRKDGSKFPALVSDWPVCGPSGELLAIVGVSVDNTERREAADHQQLLINELNHRVKNTLAIVQSISAQSFRPEAPLEVVRRRFEGRLHALAEAHGLMIQVGWRPMQLRSIIELALKPFSADGVGHRIAVDGPDLLVSPRTAVSLALATHELGTNALKYGALSSEAGVVRLDWRVAGREDSAQFVMVWREQSGPEVRPPATKGFGTRLIERGLAKELGGRVEIDFKRDGVVCTIEAPAAGALAATDEPTAMFPLPADEVGLQPRAASVSPARHREPAAPGPA